MSNPRGVVAFAETSLGGVRFRAPLLGVCNWAVSVNRMTLQLGDHGRAQVDTGRLVASSLEDKHVP